ncbi:23S rRNA (cytosine1962-C5)-methyltransferase [Ereboglobus sp. PH5-5]|uniref:class I SAM-dependent rRNA methyltransferase n=1 Tax=Ereboglobus sp. PH5-5 TaxID=2940529 RepID=UPI002405971B|nr:class I SAM-dependent rRNA methyltransferase [Ereboglobus sp. PH5-5]MDF9832656.1 23S rRNA (cytosine1962-C5)-methyltransferase [Ereboglobus sp. PH5-5]
MSDNPSTPVPASESAQAPALKLKMNARARALNGHPWVFANEVEALLPASFDGEVVECRDRTGRRIGSGIYNSRSQICWRRLSRGRVALDEAYLREVITRAIGRRESPDCDKNARRLIWSESDDLPGVVLDQFGDTLVLQIQTLAMEKRRDVIARLLLEIVKPAPVEIIFRNDAPIRRLEGLEQTTGTLSEKTWEPRWLRIDGFDYWLDLQGGQKTGFYLDQRAQHMAVARHAKGRRVLDAFCNQGPFALHCARAGAASVLGIDSAEDAIAQARKNAERNSVGAEFLAANVFDFFNSPSPEQRAETWDLIILDPPPFAKSKSALAGAMRGYKEINLRAMQRLSPGGILATYTCSHHMHEAELRQVLAEAASDARRRVSVLEFCHQPPDHPVLVTMPESEYLRGYILRVE